MNPDARIKGFDGIRGFAALLVVLTHLGLWDAVGRSGVFGARVAALLNGHTGVQLFFILSGFLITTLLVRERERAGAISIRKFVIRRSLRILPLYVLVCLLATAILFVSDRWSRVESLSYLYLYAYNFVPQRHYVDFIGHTWSLAVEEHFYLVWPFLFSWFFVARSNRLIVGLSFFVPATLVLHAWLLRQDFSAGYFVDRWSFIAGYNIALGCLAALLCTSETHRARARRFLVGGFGGLVGLALLSADFLNPSTSWYVEHVGMPYVRACGLTILVAWLWANQARMPVRVLEWSPIRYLGTISYGVYMWQGLFLSTGLRRDPGQAWPPDVLVGVVLLVIVAPLSYHYFEAPFLRVKERFAAPGSRAAGRVS